jgi:serine/threonine-protein phosphatase 6 regulatory subunit 3
MATEQLVPMLIEFLSSTHSGQLHHVASEILKGVISMSSPSQGQTGLSEDLQNNTPASNVLAREIASRACISQLITYILHPDFSSSSPSSDIHRSSIDPDHASAWVRPDLVSSSVAHAASVVIDLVRKNNSDYLEPYLFHTLRNRLIQVQQHATPEPEGARDVLEAAMREMTRKIGVIHFEILLLTVSQNLWSLKRLLEQPRRSVSRAFKYNCLADES